MPKLILAGVLPEEARNGLWDSLKAITATNVYNAVIAAVVCLIVIKLLTRVLNRALGRSRLDPPLQTVLRNVFKGVLWFVAAIIVLGCLKIEVTSLVALLSVIGLAFSLALQNFLSNMAGGMQLLASHPFKPGDYVEAGGQDATATAADKMMKVLEAETAAGERAAHAI